MAPAAHRRLALLAAAAVVWIAAGCAPGGTAGRDELVRRGDRYAADRDYRAAIIQYKNALKRDPASPLAQRKLRSSAPLLFDSHKRRAQTRQALTWNAAARSALAGAFQRPTSTHAP